MPLRRSHTKSHHGCSNCKQRRIKCDETRPSCGSCRKKGLSCSFNNSQGHPRPQNLDEHAQRRGNEGTSVLPLGELELLHHWHTVTAPSLAQNEILNEGLQTHVPREGLSHPFLMHGILAISALHLSQQFSGSRREIYTETAMRHHSWALSLCVPLLSNVTPENCQSLYACSILIATFSFASQGLSIYRPSMHISEVIKIFRLVRGTASIVEQARSWIEQSDMRILLALIRYAQWTPGSRHVHTVHTQLETLLNQQEDELQSPQLPGSSKVVIIRSTRHLLDVFDSCIASDNQATILAWPAVVDSEFLDLMQQREPWALVMLAYYGAVLHLTTRAWWIEGWGKFLVNLAAGYLDDHTRSAIAWPIAVVNKEICE